MFPIKAPPNRSLSSPYKSTLGKSAWGWLTLFFVAAYFAFSPAASAPLQKYSAHEYVSSAINPIELLGEPIPVAQKHGRGLLPVIVGQNTQDNIHVGGAEPVLSGSILPSRFTPLVHLAASVDRIAFTTHRFFRLAQPRAPPAI